MIVASINPQRHRIYTHFRGSLYEIAFSFLSNTLHDILLCLIRYDSSTNYFIGENSIPIYMCFFNIFLKFYCVAEYFFNSLFIGILHAILTRSLITDL